MRVKLLIKAIFGFILLIIAMSNANAETKTLTVPYINQVYDMDQSDFNGHNACGPASAVMMINFHNLLPNNSSGYDGWYVYNPYVGTVDRSGQDYSGDNTTELAMDMDGNENHINQVAGAHGYIVSQFGTDWMTSLDRLELYLRNHGLIVDEFIGTSISRFEKIKQNIDAGLPLIGHWSGHYFVIIGYDTGISGVEQKVVVHDPYGDKTSTWNGTTSGEALTYNFPIVSPGAIIDRVYTVHPVGIYSEYIGYKTDGRSQAFVNAYNQYADTIGHPYDNGGGVFVHEYFGIYSSSFSVWIQDFYNPDTNKHYALILNDLEDEPKAYLLQGAIRNFYMNNDGAYNFGVPFTEEIAGKLADSHLSVSTDIITPSGANDYVNAKDIVVQKFKRRLSGGMFYNNERKTLVHDPDDGDTGHMAVGEFAVNPDVLLNGTYPVSSDTVKFADPSNPYTKYNWPIENENTVPTSYVSSNCFVHWFTKAGSYLVYTYDSSGTMVINGLAHQILEGNLQFVGSDINVPANVNASSVSSSQINISWNVLEDADSYKIYRSESGSPGTSGLIANISDINYSDISLISSKTYYYWVKGVINGIDTNFSLMTSATTQSSQVIPVSVASTSTYKCNDGVIISASNVFDLNATDYDSFRVKAVLTGSGVTISSIMWKIYSSTGRMMVASSGGNNILVSGSVDTTVDMDLISTMYPGMTRAELYIDDNLKEVINFEIENSSSLSVPNVTITSGIPPVSFSWKSVDGATHYNIHRAGTFYRQVSADTTSYSDTGTAPGYTYPFAVFAKNATEVSIPFVMNITVSSLATPTNLVANQEGMSVNLTWGAVYKAHGYEVWRDGSMLSETSSVSFIDNTVTHGNTHTYTVRAKYNHEGGQAYYSDHTSPVDFVLPDYAYIGASVCESVTDGTEPGSMVAVNPKVIFNEGDTVFCLAEMNNVYIDHEFKVEVWKDSLFYWDYSSGVKDVGIYPWNYSNFSFSQTNAAPGSYEFKIFFDTGNGFTQIDSKSFTVNQSSADYTYSGAEVCESVTDGTEPGSLVAVNPKAVFTEGETIYCLAEMTNVYVDHQFKVEVYKDGTFQWDFSPGLKDVGLTPWDYSNFTFNQTNASPGNYEFKIFFDDGSGYSLIDTKTATVNQSSPDYVYNDSTICESVTAGTNPGSMVAVNPKTVFTAGETAYCLTEMNNVYVDHRYKVEVWKDSVFFWDYSSNWNTVGQYPWEYSIFTPSQSNAPAGSYEFKIFLDVGNGFIPLATETFTVN